ncbi:MAG: extracellular solute-binding protein, partial [Treponema sp.]|nr:extracellular solute-binding protein [Treponema sp.]
MKKTIGVMMILLAAAAVFSCRRGEQPGAQGGRTRVVLWHAMGGLAGETLNKFTADYNASQGAVEVEAQYQGNYDDAITKLRATPAGQGPDIMQLYEIGTRWAIDSGSTLKMQDFINKDNYDVSDYEPNILAYYTFGGELYSMPFNCSSPVV